MADKTFNYESFGETIFFAESLGWSKEWGDPNADADALEEDAIEYIEAKGYIVRYHAEDEGGGCVDEFNSYQKANAQLDLDRDGGERQ